MKLATTTGDLYAYTPSLEVAMAYLREAGFRYLDYNFGSEYGGRTGIYSANASEYIENIRKKADRLGLRFVQSHAPMGKPLAKDNEAFIADTIACIDACHALEIPSLVVHSGYVKGLSKEETFEKNKEFFMPLLHHAEKYGVNILVENFNKMCVDNLYWIDNAPDLLAMIEYVDHPLFHAVWDTGHANMQDMPQDEALKILGNHVMALHVQDNMENEDSHMAPFFGTLNLDSLMHGLLAIDYKGYFTFEAGNIFLPQSKRRPFDKDTRLLRAPFSLRLEAVKFLYAIGKCILEAYDCFEE